MTEQMEMKYPAAPGYKVGGASKEAAQRIHTTAKTLREQVLAAFQIAGAMTADECAARLDKSILSIRPRVTELTKLEKLRKLADTRPGQFGMNQHLYEIR